MPEDVTEPAVRRSQLDVLQAQLRAIDAWHRAQHCQQGAAEPDVLTREMRLDLARRKEGLRREQQALIARTDEQLRASGTVALSAGPRAVLAHRSDWFREKVRARLAERGIVVVRAVDDGADAAGTVVAEQPDLVLVEDRLPTLLGVEVVRRTRQFAPAAFIGAQVSDRAGTPTMVDAGAGAVFTRRMPPVEMADHLIGCLTGERRSLVLV